MTPALSVRGAINMYAYSLMYLVLFPAVPFVVYLCPRADHTAYYVLIPASLATLIQFVLFLYAATCVYRYRPSLIARCDTTQSSTFAELSVGDVRHSLLSLTVAVSLITIMSLWCLFTQFMAHWP